MVALCVYAVSEGEELVTVLGLGEDWRTGVGRLGGGRGVRLDKKNKKS